MLLGNTSTTWRPRGLKRVPRSDLDYLIQRAFLSTCVGTIIICYPNRGLNKLHFSQKQLPREMKTRLVI